MSTLLVLTFLTYGFAFLALWRVQSVVRKWTEVAVLDPLTGHEAASALLEQDQVEHVTIEVGQAWLADVYIPGLRIISLSHQAYHGTSVAAISMAAHAAGHALQDHHGYRLLRITLQLDPFARIASVVGIVLGIASTHQSSPLLSTVASLLLSFFLAHTLLWVVVQRDAYRRTLTGLQATGKLRPDELSGVRAVLRAAITTYITTSLGALIRLAAVFGRRR